KDGHEQSLMRRAGAISSGAHRRAMEHVRPGWFEYQAEGEVRQEFLRCREQSLIPRAGALSSGAHRRAMEHVRPGWFEYQAEAELLHEFLRCGAQSVAYPSIVASGPNACVLHYRDNNREMADGDLLLIDAGCEYQGYASDITRTFPVNGKFSGPQKDIYELVLASQLACLDAVKPGAP